MTATLTIPKQREKVTNRDYRIANANIALSCFADGTTISDDGRGHLLVSWTRKGYGKEPEIVFVFKRWQVRGGQDFYPVWSRKWGHGGASCTALSQLIRWIQGRPVLPLSTWRYWAGERCQLARDEGPRLIERLIYVGWPETASCVLCGRSIESGLDWWNLNGVSGPCCGWTTGCRQAPRHAAVRRGGSDELNQQRSEA